MTERPDAHVQGSESENPVIDAPTPATDGRPRTNKDWWPDQLELQVLKKHATVSTPVGDAPCLTPSHDHGFAIDEAEVVYRGLCPTCARAGAAT